MSNRAEEVANAVLYEGYILYPYRPSSVKNQQRWNFGVVYPPGSSEGVPTMQTQCLALASSVDAELDVKVRFLQLMARTVAELDEPVLELVDDAEPSSHPVQRIECDGQVFQAWQEGAEREVLLAGCRLNEVVCHQFAFPASRTIQPLRNPDGRIAWLIVREQQAVSGQVEVSSEPAGGGLYRITVRILNLTPHRDHRTRDSALLRSLVSAHKILTVRGGEFVSLIDPPKFCRQAAEKCQNVGTWPVLAGEEGQRNVMLSSPIILYDYPQIAPESAGDLCDGTEIDEILSLRILTLTDEEKREMRQSDDRGRRILERTEALPEEQWLKLHGVLRGLRPASKGNPMNEWEWQLLEDKAPVESLNVAGVDLKAGDHVRLRPRKGGDIFDMALAGMVATIESIEQDYEGQFQLAVVVDDDPGRDMGMKRQPGHRFFFAPEEVEPVAATAPNTILIAGIGNIFLGDDAFGVEVAKRLANRQFPTGVRVVDFGIRGFDLAYALMDGPEVTILVDACPRGGAPGTVYVIEPDPADLNSKEIQSAPAEGHSMNPVSVLRLATSMGGQLKRILLVGCEPEFLGGDEGHMGLSASVEAAVGEAVAVVESLVQGILSGELK